MRLASVSILGVTLVVALWGCGGGGDAGRDAYVPLDASVDSSVSDSGRDSGGDASVGDSATADSSTADSSTTDSATDDASTDAGGAMTSCAVSPCTGGALCIGGPACGDAWTCIVSDRACTDDIIPYCGCDGVTFMESSTCVTRAIAHLGTCEDGANCDRRAVSCRRVEPICPDGQVPEVQGTCWTDRCIPIEECACTSAAQCPMPGSYTCHNTINRCGPYV